MRSSVRIGELTQIHRFAIGFLTLALLTSLPEVSVAVSSVRLGEPEVSISNVLGSNVANICLIIGSLAILRPIAIGRGLRSIPPILLAVTGLFSLTWIRGFSRVLGLILIALFVVLCYHVLYKAIAIEERRRVAASALDLAINLVLLWLGILGLFASAFYVVESVVTVAELAGIAAAVIAATIIAFGTSLPELSTALVACKQGEVELALGNIIGSCLINLTLVLGVTLAFSAEIGLAPYLGIFLFLVVVTGIFSLLAQKARMGMLTGVLLLGLYGLYLATIGYAAGHVSS